MNLKKIQRTVSFILSLLFMALFACSKEEAGSVGPTKIFSDDLKGEWQWVESGGGFSGQLHKPSPGNQQSILITKDSIFYFTNDALDRKYKYHLSRDTVPCLNDSVSIMDFDPSSFPLNYTLRQDSLWFGGICIVDFGYSLYSRK